MQRKPRTGPPRSVPRRPPTWLNVKRPEDSGQLPHYNGVVWKGGDLLVQEELLLEYREEAVKLVIETSRPVSQVAKDLLINAGTLANWVKAYRRAHAVDQPELTVDERGRLKEQEREICELQLEIAFLKKAATYFTKEQR